jgi:two-component system, OmpR family, sensor histidine kinase KdpD
MNRTVRMAAKEMQERSLKIALGCAMALLLTLAAFRLHFNLSSATSLHLFLVAAIALRWGFIEASVVSLLSVACLDYFFTTPLFAFYMTDTHDWVALGTFEAAALLVSTLSNRATRHGRESELHQAQLQKLYDLSQQILLLDREATVEQRISDLLRSSLHVEGVALWNAYNLHMCRSGACDLSDEDVRSTFYTEKNSDDRETGVAMRVLRSGTRPIGSLVLCGHSLDFATVNAASSLTAVAIERARSFTTEASAEAARQSEQLRAAILDGLAHAFKSPLTTILTSSSGLLAMGTLSGTEKRLVSLIDQHATHLSELATHLLLTARLDSGEIKLKREQLDLNELIRQSAEASSAMLDGHAIEFRTAPRPRLVYADRKLMEMALLQLFDNAVKYGLPGSPVIVEVLEEQAELLITVTNEGSFIAAEEREKVFQRFYRSAGSARAISGTGIGLSVVRRITEAHHGRSWVNSDHSGETRFTLTLPRIAGQG